MKPCEQFRQAFYATYEEESSVMALRYSVGVDRLMWGCDYPHAEGTFSNSRATVANTLKDVPDKEVNKMTRTIVLERLGLILPGKFSNTLTTESLLNRVLRGSDL